ncbi:B12-binding domain-containing radical SAM protein [Irregularibacter muris]|uniref:B12-binding domain-containing radical SAM protein n=1 Tax=Irregularibacter muris TaxID=1796619 RepID=A0AAE3KYW9_9FIRM|nr:B12-binding domain-containing radical SAM protein [Irregularibacter muris]MCR1897736.1 B12-binding domain-containing radical SAM protein [Irregularibacter muris]
MKVLLISLNAKYIHTNLAIRYLESYCRNREDIDIEISEFTINDNLQSILGEIYKKRANILAFSCYIWNIEESMKIVRMIKKIQPGIKIVLGGPEVTFYGTRWMNRAKEIDYIVKGEGEISFYELLEEIKFGGENLHEIEGIIYRQQDKIIENKDRAPLKELDSVPFPYPEDLSDYENKIIYYESSRGCPFHCQYCLSSTTGGVSFFSLSRVKEELKTFINAKVKQVKFVDRTFNCDKKRTKELLRYLIAQGGDTNFHFEVAADLIDQEMLDIFKEAPVGLFQLEIGIQSTYAPTLEAIRRKNDLSKIEYVVNRIHSYKNIHQHLDLIAGLPYESYECFKKSFNDVYALKPDMLQLGFLKILKGSGIEVDNEKYGYQYTPYPPYEVLLNDHISYEEILKLKAIEDLVEKYSNAHIFDYTIDYLIQHHYQSPFDFFEDFAIYWEEKDLYRQFHSQKYLYKILLDYCKSIFGDFSIIHELLKFDYLLTHKGPLPEFFIENIIENKKEKSFEFLKHGKNIEKYLPEYINNTPKEIYKNVHFELFDREILQLLKIKKGLLPTEELILMFHFPKEPREINQKSLYDWVNL